MTTFIFIIILATIVLASVIGGGGNVTYPLLKNRLPDSNLWQFNDIDVTITAAYLEVISYAFSLNNVEEIFQLRPTDSLEDLYDSYYKRNLFGVDDLELELCAMNYEKLCQTADIEFAYQSTIYDQLKTIAQCRNNQPVTDEECATIGIEMKFLPLLKTKETIGDKNR